MRAGIPREIGGYTIEKKLSEGGMGAVLLGVKRTAGGFVKKVAIKTVLPEHEKSSDYRDLFFDEAKLVARMTHPHLCQVFDFGEDQGTLYLVMEFVEGLSVEAIIRYCIETKTRVPPGLAVRIISQAARGLHHAHTLRDETGAPLNVVHRDVSPQNIIVTPSGNTKVIDFGIAKSEARSNQTQMGIVRGKPGYMAPEQARGQPLDARTDIFQLGIVLHELLGLAPLYLRVDIYESIRLAVEEPPTLLSPRFPEVDPAVDDVIAVALQKDPANRFSTADAMARALDSIVAKMGAFGSESALSDFITSIAGPKMEGGDPTAKTESGRPDGAGTQVITPSSAQTGAPVGRPVSSPTVALKSPAPGIPAPRPEEQSTAALPVQRPVQGGAVVQAAATTVVSPDGVPAANTAASLDLALGKRRGPWIAAALLVVIAAGVVAFLLWPFRGASNDDGDNALAVAQDAAQVGAADAGASGANTRDAAGANADIVNGDTTGDSGASPASRDAGGNVGEKPERKRSRTKRDRSKKPRKPKAKPKPTGGEVVATPEPATPPSEPVAPPSQPPPPVVADVGTGYLVVRTKTRAQIVVDGQKLGKDFDRIVVGAGKHRVKVVWEDNKMKPDTRTVTIVKNKTVTLKIKK